MRPLDFHTLRPSLLDPDLLDPDPPPDVKLMLPPPHDRKCHVDIKGYPMLVGCADGTAYFDQQKYPHMDTNLCKFEITNLWQFFRRYHRQCYPISSHPQFIEFYGTQATSRSERRIAYFAKYKHYRTYIDPAGFDEWLFHCDHPAWTVHHQWMSTNPTLGIVIPTRHAQLLDKYGSNYEKRLSSPKKSSRVLVTPISRDDKNRVRDNMDQVIDDMDKVYELMESMKSELEALKLDIKKKKSDSRNSKKVLTPQVKKSLKEPSTRSPHDSRSSTTSPNLDCAIFGDDLQKAVISSPPSNKTQVVKTVTIPSSSKVQTPVQSIDGVAIDKLHDDDPSKKRSGVQFSKNSIVHPVY